MFRAFPRHFAISLPATADRQWTHLAFSVAPVEVASLEIFGVNSTDIGSANGVTMGSCSVAFKVRMSYAAMGDEGGKGRMDYRPARFPAQDDRCLTIVETLGGRARKMREGILVAANQGEKIPRVAPISRCCFLW